MATATASLDKPAGYNKGDLVTLTIVDPSRSALTPVAVPTTGGPITLQLVVTSPAGAPTSTVYTFTLKSDTPRDRHKRLDDYGMTTTVVTVPTADGGSLQIPLIVNANPFPVVKWSSRRTGDTLPGFLSRLSTFSLVDFEGATVTVADFAQGAWNHSATDNGGWGVLGGWCLGFLNVNLSMVPGSSTKGALVNALPKYSGNNYTLARLGRGANPNMPNPAYLSGEIDATVQGHNFSGFQSYETVNAQYGPLTIKGVPGSAGGVPPYETMSFAFYKDLSPTLTDVFIDGLGVGASGIGSSGQDSAGVWTYNRVTVQNMTHGAGITHYNMTNTTFNFTDCTTRGIAYAGINFERCSGSTANMVRHTFDSCGADIVADSDKGFITLNIVDPILTPAHPRVKIVVHSKYDYPPPDVDPNKQIDALTNNHTTLTVGGVSRPDLIDWETSYSPIGGG